MWFYKTVFLYGRFYKALVFYTSAPIKLQKNKELPRATWKGGTFTTREPEAAQRCRKKKFGDGQEALIPPFNFSSPFFLTLGAWSVIGPNLNRE